MRFAPLVLLLSVACGGARPTDSRREVRLVVLLVIDQLPSWSFLRREKLFRAGLARLVAEGRVYERGRYPYAATYTGPGHAALATGQPPAASGIVANNIWDRALGKQVPNIHDAEHVGSPRRLLAPAVADGMVGGSAVAISFKMRSAILLGGHRPAAALWWDDGLKRFNTSTYYPTPAWLASVPAEVPPGPWTPRDPELLARETGGPDDAPGEGSYDGLGPTFPHETDGPALKYAPAADELVLGAALAALATLGGHAAPDFLAVSFSAHDYSGHLWGQESWETLDVLLRLDEKIGRLLDAIDARVGRGRALVVLTSDHGAVPLIERTGMGRRIAVEQVKAAAQEAAVSVLGQGDWVLRARDPNLYLADGARRDDVLDRVTDAVLRVPGVGYAYRTDRIAGGCDARPPPEAAVCRSVLPGVSGDVFWGPEQGSVVLTEELYPVSHGSRHSYDTDVPVLVMGPGFAPGRVREPVSMLRVAPTLARALGVPVPTVQPEPPL